MMAGAEGERSFDLDVDAVLGNVRAIMPAMHDKAAGFDRRQSGEALAHPIGRFDRSELQRRRGFSTGGRGHRIPHRLALCLVAEINRDLPARATGVGQADRDILKRKTLGNCIGDRLRGYR